MNCMYETVASLILHIKRNFTTGHSSEYELCRAEDNLEDCRSNLSAKERDLATVCAHLLKEAALRRASGDNEGAVTKLRERKRQLARLDKLRNSILVISNQLEALRSRELDRDVMESLKLSSQAMKKAGIQVGVKEAEKVMNDLDTQMQQSSEISTVLSAPVSDDFMADMEIDLAELDAELGLHAEPARTKATPPSRVSIPASSNTNPPVPEHAPKGSSRQQSQPSPRISDALHQRRTANEDM